MTPYGEVKITRFAINTSRARKLRARRKALLTDPFRCAVREHRDLVTVFEREGFRPDQARNMADNIIRSQLGIW